MDRHATILASLPGLEAKLRQAGFEHWLEEHKAGKPGDRKILLGGHEATEAEAMLWFASERGLVDAAAVEAAAARQPLEPDVEAVEIGPEEQGES